MMVCGCEKRVEERGGEGGVDVCLGAGRVDNVFGDRNLVCTNPPVEEPLAAAA